MLTRHFFLVGHQNITRHKIFHHAADKWLWLSSKVLWLKSSTNPWQTLEDIALTKKQYIWGKLCKHILAEEGTYCWKPKESNIYWVKGHSCLEDWLTSWGNAPQALLAKDCADPLFISVRFLNCPQHRWKFNNRAVWNFLKSSEVLKLMTYRKKTLASFPEASALNNHWSTRDVQ